MSKRESGGTALVVIITPAPSGVGRYEARLDGDDRILCVSRTPFFDAARKMLADGHDPNGDLVLRHAGSVTDSLKAKIGSAASLTVEETPFGPKVRRWRPLPALAVAPRIAPINQTATAHTVTSISDPIAVVVHSAR